MSRVRTSLRLKMSLCCGGWDTFCSRVQKYVMQQWRNLMNSKTLGEFSQGERNIRVLRSFFRVLLFVSSGPESQLLTKWAEMEEGISFLTGTIVFTNINQSYLWDVRLVRLSCIWNQGLLSICVELRIMSLLRFELRIMMSLLRWPSLSSFRETARRVKSGRVRSNVRSQSSWRWSSLALWDWRLER